VHGRAGKNYISAPFYPRSAQREAKSELKSTVREGFEPSVAFWATAL
jgi:hypothetical protein